MNTKEWLTQGKNINREIRALKDARDKANTMYEVCETTTIKKYKDNLDSKILQLTKTHSEILCAIYKVEDAVLRTLLIERYINDKTWENVALRLGYDFYHVIKHLYPKALTEIEKIKKAS